MFILQDHLLLIAEKALLMHLKVEDQADLVDLTDQTDLVDSEVIVLNEDLFHQMLIMSELLMVIAG